MLLYNS